MEVKLIEGLKLKMKCCISDKEQDEWTIEEKSNK